MLKPSVYAPIWENLLDPEKLRPSLVRGGLYLTVYELVVDFMIGVPESLVLDSQPKRHNPAHEFRMTVVPLAHRKRKTVLESALKWWGEQGVVEPEDFARWERVCDYRHEVAHELVVHLLLGVPEVFEARFEELVRLLCKLDDWCRSGSGQRALAVAGSKGTKLQEVFLQTRIHVQVMIGSAIGDPDEAKELLREFQRQHPQWFQPNPSVTEGVGGLSEA